jgi:hypothetical protein
MAHFARRVTPIATSRLRVLLLVLLELLGLLELLPLCPLRIAKQMDMQAVAVSVTVMFADIDQR